MQSDDRVIKEEGLDNLTDDELRGACRSRGMRTPYGEGAVTFMRKQLQEWLDLSLNRYRSTHEECCDTSSASNWLVEQCAEYQVALLFLNSVVVCHSQQYLLAWPSEGHSGFTHTFSPWLQVCHCCCPLTQCAEEHCHCEGY